MIDGNSSLLGLSVSPLLMDDLVMEFEKLQLLRPECQDTPFF